jgi:hypothetical protein
MISKKNKSGKTREDDAPPICIEDWGWKYHHLGIPTGKKLPGEVYLPQFKVYVSGFNTSPFGVEWMRYEEGSPVNELIKTVPHLAFEVADLDQELADHDLHVITEPNMPSDNIRVAMIEHNGAPIELIEFKRNIKII